MLMPSNCPSRDGKVSSHRMLNCACEVGAWAAREITKGFVNFSFGGLLAGLVKGGDRLILPLSGAAT
jgi:hypothetical protein